ncbi:MAG: lipoprotein-releasing ABC transporter permease subunit [Rickettsiales bacterium]
MFSHSEKLIALRFFSSKRKEKFISVNTAFAFLGITLGVATLIIVMSVMNGFRVELVKRILGVNAHITIYSTQKNLANYGQLVENLTNIQGVLTANPIIDTHGMITKDEIASAALVKGIKKIDLINKKLISNNIISGDLNNFTNGDKIVIGDRLARKLGVAVGDKINLIAPNTTNSIFGIVPRLKEYKIIAIFRVGMHEYDANAIFIPFATAQIQFGLHNAASAIEIITADANNTQVINDKIYNQLMPLSHNLIINDWQEMNSSFINALKVERNVMFLILSLIIIVAAFNIISSLIMLVNDKIKHIALLRTMGMSQNSIVKIFFINGALIGAIGTILGSLIGISFAYNIDKIKRLLEKLTGVTLFDPIIYFLTDLPAEVNLYTVMLIVITSLIICFIAAIYPAFKAAKLDPAEVLRYE